MGALGLATMMYKKKNLLAVFTAKNIRFNVYN